MSFEIYDLSITYISRTVTVSGQLPTRTIPHRTGIGPDEWFYSVVVVLAGSCPGGEYSQGSWSQWAMAGLYFYPVGIKKIPFQGYLILPIISRNFLSQKKILFLIFFLCFLYHLFLTNAFSKISLHVGFSVKVKQVKYLPPKLLMDNTLALLVCRFFQLFRATLACVLGICVTTPSDASVWKTTSW